MKSLLFVLVLTCFFGCHSPETSKILGTPWPTERVVALRGWWKNSDSELCRVSPKKMGSGVVVASLDRESDDQGFAVLNLDCTFTRIGNRDFVFAKNLNLHVNREGYGFALVTKCDKDEIEIANPDNDVFVELVENAKINGEIRNADEKFKKWALIHSEDEMFLKAIENEGFERCFPTKTTLKLIRQLTTKD